MTTEQVERRIANMIRGVYRKRDWWWDWTWTPVSGCNPVSPGCKYCWSLPWLRSRWWPIDTVYTGAIERAVDGSTRWTGDFTSLQAGDPVWNWPLDPSRGVSNPALGPGKPNLIFAVVDGDLFATGRPPEHIKRVCSTLVASKHYGLLCTKYTAEMADYIGSIHPRSVERWQQKLLLGFSAENQEWFDKRWAEVRALAEAGWRVYVALSPLLEQVVLPANFRALGSRTWVVVYGECNRWKPKLCRPMDADWVRAIRAQCQDNGIPFFLRGMHTGASIPLDLIDDPRHNNPTRQFPVLP